MGEIRCGNRLSTSKVVITARRHIKWVHNATGHDKAHNTSVCCQWSPPAVELSTNEDTPRHTVLVQQQAVSNSLVLTVLLLIFPQLWECPDLQNRLTCWMSRALSCEVAENRLMYAA